jgi:hypothetical protein
VSRSGPGGVEKNSQLLSGLEPQIIHLVAERYTTELSRASKLLQNFRVSVLYLLSNNENLATVI